MVTSWKHVINIHARAKTKSHLYVYNGLLYCATITLKQGKYTCSDEWKCMFMFCKVKIVHESIRARYLPFKSHITYINVHSKKF